MFECKYTSNIFEGRESKNSSAASQDMEQRTRVANFKAPLLKQSMMP
jgi:hypothetical protein